MTYFPIPVEQFGGLNLADDPGELGFSGAIDICDVDLDREGRVRSRDLFAQLATSTLTSPSVVGVGRVYYLLSTAASVKVYTGSTLVGTAVAPAQYFNSSVQPIGTPSADYFYLADSGQTVRRLDPAAVLTAPAGMPKCSFLARTAISNRLVALNIAAVPTGSGATASGSLVHFSDPGAPETWGANNYIYLDPGDGETITGGAVFGNSLYVFKQTKIYEFYGESTDASGNPIFNYRTVSRGLGCITVPSDGPVTGPDGVYFPGVSNGLRSIFRINHTGVVDIGRPVRPALNTATTPSTFTPGTLGAGALSSAFAAGQYRILTTGSGGPFCLNYSPEAGSWTIYQMPSGTAYLSAAGNAGQDFLVAGTGANASVHNLDLAAVTVSDSLRTPTPYYQSGFENLAPPRRYIDKYGFGPSRKRVPRWRVAGSGTVTMAVAVDEGSTKGATSLTLGVSPAIAEKPYQWAIRGAKLSYKLSGAGPWSINNLVALLADTREPGSDVSDS